MSLASLGITGNLPNIFEWGEKQTKQYVDLTDDVLDRIFPPIPNYFRLIHIDVVGKQGSGKSEFLKFIAWCAMNRYGIENINITLTDNLRINMEIMDTKPVQLLFVDDATSFASSREIHKQTQLVRQFQRLRHLAKEKSTQQSGLVVVVFSWQRWMDLDPAFRDAMIIFLKTGLIGKTDRTEIQYMLGNDYNRYLYSNWDLMNRGIESAKSNSVVFISSLAGTGQECGLFKSRMVDFPEYPDMIKSDDYFKESEEEQEKDVSNLTINDLRDKEDWKDAVSVYDAVVTEGLSIRKTAEKLDLSKSKVERLLSKIEKVLEIE